MLKHIGHAYDRETSRLVEVGYIDAMRFEAELAQAFNAVLAQIDFRQRGNPHSSAVNRSEPFPKPTSSQQPVEAPASRS